jgi:putative colanic acid biosynthesis acetyltransferase WcaF
MHAGHHAVEKDPYLRPNTSFLNRVVRSAWGITYVFFFRPSPRIFHGWRSLLLRMFGAKLGPNCHIYPGARIWAPWNLICEDAVGVADGAEIYNPAPITLGSHSIISQQAYLCGATHDYNDPSFPMIWAPITVGRFAWVAARAVVQMGVNVGDGAVLGLGAIATEDLQPWTVYAGTPARKIGVRSEEGFPTRPS